MMKKFVFVSCLIFLFAACSPTAPSEGMIQTAIAETQAVVPTFINTNTPVPTLTSTITVTASPTPDLRIINIDPQDFLLKPEELPREAKYYLPNSAWISPHLNSEVVSGWTVEKGKEYLARTGRINGWVVYYAKGTRTVYAPDEIFNNVIMFNSSTGASLFVTDYSYRKRFPKENWEAVDYKIENLGQVYDVERKVRVTSGGDKLIQYCISFAYYNYGVMTCGTGLEKDIVPEIIETGARAVLKKLQNAQLVFPPTETPEIVSTSTPTP